MGWVYGTVYSKTKENIGIIADKVRKANEVDATSVNFEITRGLYNLVKKNETAFKEMMEELSGVKVVRAEPIDNGDYCLLTIWLKE